MSDMERLLREAHDKASAAHALPLSKHDDQPDDPVSPSHYRSGGMEAIDVVDAFDLGFNLGNAWKYIARCGRKGTPADAVTDLRKSIWLIEREIASRTKGRP